MVSFRLVPTRNDDEDLAGTSPIGVSSAEGGAPRFELHVFLGGATTTHVLPFAGSVTIGRSRSAEICIDDASVSRRHALLHVGSTLLVQDLGSQNGTRVGTDPIPPHRNVPLSAGVPFVVGAISVVVQPIRSDAVVPVRAPIVAARPPDAAPREARTLRDEVALLERARIVDALAACGGNQTKAAALLGMPRRTLVLRLAEYQIPRPRK